MAFVPGSKSMAPGATEAPQATSPSQPGDAVAIAHWGARCLLELLLGRRLPLDPPFSIGCGLGEYSGHKGLDFYKTVGDIPVKRSCGFTHSGVFGANVYPAFPGCSHQASLAKVVYAQDAGGRVGNCVILEHTDNTHEIWIRTIYMHLATIAVTVGQFIPTTTAIGTVGYTGGYASTNAHLHFEVNEQRPANPSWRIATELATMPDKIVVGRPAIDPEIYLPDVAGGELLRVATVPPPVPVPSGPPPAYQGLLDPIWLTYKLPFSGADHVQRVDTADGDGNPRWYMSAWDTVGGTVDVYPICGGPDQRIYVARTDSTCVTLLHLDAQYRVMVMSEYLSLTTVSVVQGTFITPTTKVGESNAAVDAVHGVSAFLFRRKATNSGTWEASEPFDWSTYRLTDQMAVYEYLADPACCLPEPDTFYATGGSPTWSHERDCVSEPGWA